MSYRLTTLDNGLRILTVPQPEALSVSLMVIADAGAKNENEKNSGISHFLEHMGFKGTEERSRVDLSGQLDALGASYNAFTGHDATAYYITVMPEKVEQAIELLSDMYLHSILPDEEVAKERGVIIEEIKLYEDQPRSFVWDVFTKMTYPGAAAGRLVIGERETVSAISREDLLTYRGQHYTGSSTILVAVGNFNEDNLIKILNTKFDSLAKGEVFTRSLVAENQEQARVELAIRPIDQSHLVMGFRSVDLSNDKVYPLMVLASVLGGGMSSRLWQKVREDLGAAYYVGAQQSSSLDHGYLAIYAGVESQRLTLIIKEIISELKKIKTEAPSAEELSRVKDHMIGNIFLGLETPSSQTYFYGEQSLIGKEILSLQQLAEKIRLVTAEELKDLAGEIFQSDRLNLAIVGPECSLAKIKAELDV